MKTPVWPVLACFALTACPNGGNNDGGADAGPDASVVTTSCANGFCVGTLDPTSDPEKTPLAMAVLPGDKVAVAYYQPVGGDAGYELHYLEYANGVATAPVKIETGKDSSNNPRYTSERVMDLSLAVQPSGEPAIAFLGGYTAGEAFWFQNDAYLATRAGGVWTSVPVVKDSGEAVLWDGTPTSPPTSGTVVGIDPALAYDTNGTAWLVYRDVQNGQSPNGDYGGSDLEVAFGSGLPATWTKNVIADGNGGTGGIGKVGYGSHSRLQFVGGAMTLVGDRRVGTYDGPGLNPYFTQRGSNGQWSPPVKIINIANDQSGPSYQYDAQEKYAVAVAEISSADALQPNGLYYVTSPDGANWNSPDPVFQLGTGGWWPSLAFDASHIPHIAYYYCDGRSGIAQSSCRTSDDELRITYRDASDQWQVQTVDPAGGQYPKLAFLSTGKRVVVYRDVTRSGPTSGVLKIAVEE